MTIKFEWHQDDERIIGREDSCWYTFGSENDAVVTISNSDNSVTICSDGEMRVNILDGDYVGIVRYCDQWSQYGINNDADVHEASENGRIVWVDNSWFDLYGNIDYKGYQYLDCVCHSLTEAIDTALSIIKID